jgi:hypothetical protein
MNLRILVSGFQILLAFVLVSWGEEAPPTTDAELAARIVGTWVRPAGGELPYIDQTYRPDGTFGCFMFGPPPHRRADFSGKWEIKSGYLNREIVTTTDPERLPIGLKSSDKIIKLTKDEFVFENKDGIQETLHHK